MATKNSLQIAMRGPVKDYEIAYCASLKDETDELDVRQKFMETATTIGLSERAAEWRARRARERVRRNLTDLSGGTRRYRFDSVLSTKEWMEYGDKYEALLRAGADMATIHAAMGKAGTHVANDAARRVRMRRWRAVNPKRDDETTFQYESRVAVGVRMIRRDGGTMPTKEGKEYGDKYDALLRAGADATAIQTAMFRDGFQFHNDVSRRIRAQKWRAFHPKRDDETELQYGIRVTDGIRMRRGGIKAPMPVELIEPAGPTKEEQEEKEYGDKYEALLRADADADAIRAGMRGNRLTLYAARRVRSQRWRLVHPKRDDETELEYENRVVAGVLVKRGAPLKHVKSEPKPLPEPDPEPEENLYCTEVTAWVQALAPSHHWVDVKEVRNAKAQQSGNVVPVPVDLPKPVDPPKSVVPKPVVPKRVRNRGGEGLCRICGATESCRWTWHEGVPRSLCNACYDVRRSERKRVKIEATGEDEIELT